MLRAMYSVSKKKLSQVTTKLKPLGCHAGSEFPVISLVGGVECRDVVFVLHGCDMPHGCDHGYANTADFNHTNFGHSLQQRNSQLRVRGTLRLGFVVCIWYCWEDDGPHIP